MNKKTKRNICAFCIAMSSALSFSVIYAFSSYYVAFQTATGFSNTQLGLLLTVLGIASTVFYVPSGYLADKFDVRKLTVLGLIGSGAIGFLIALFPPYPIMLLLYVLFPAFGIMVSWNAQIKMIRMLAPDEENARIMTVRAYGRTVPALIIGFGGSALLAMLDDKTALNVTLILYGVLTIVAAVLAWITYDPVQKDTSESKPISVKDYFSVMKHKEVWIIGIIGFCAYCSSAGVTYLQPYLTECFGMSSSLSSVFGILAKNIAIIAAPILTWIATKRKIPLTKVLGISMIFAAVSFLIFVIIPGTEMALYFAMLLYFIGAFVIMAAWALQYVPITEVGIPLEITGTAVGFVSILSFVGDIFYWTICGNFIDKYTDLTGYRIVFGMTAGLMILGMCLCFVIVGMIVKKQKA